jgi:flagellar hook assembly protein FlgD
MPNPANAGTAIVLSMPEAEHASVSVYDVAGRRVAVLIDDLVQAGQHRVFWDTRSDDGNLISSGIYFIRVTAGLEEHVEKVVIAR